MFFCQRASQSVLVPGSANGFAFPPGAAEARPSRMLLAVEATAMVLTETPLKNSRRFIDGWRLYFGCARRQHLSPRASVGTSRQDVRPAFSRAFGRTAKQRLLGLRELTFSDGTAPLRRMNPFLSLGARPRSAGSPRSIPTSSMLSPFQVMPETSAAVMANDQAQRPGSRGA